MNVLAFLIGCSRMGVFVGRVVVDTRAGREVPIGSFIGSDNIRCQDAVSLAQVNYWLHENG